MKIANGEISPVKVNAVYSRTDRGCCGCARARPNAGTVNVLNGKSSKRPWIDLNLQIELGRVELERIGLLA